MNVLHMSLQKFEEKKTSNSDRIKMQMIMICMSTVFKHQNFKQHTEYGNLQQRQKQTQSHITLAQTITDKKHLNKACLLHSRFGAATPRDCHSQHRPYIFQQNSIAQNYILKQNSIDRIYFSRASPWKWRPLGVAAREPIARTSLLHRSP